MKLPGPFRSPPVMSVAVPRCETNEAKRSTDDVCLEAMASNLKAMASNHMIFGTNEEMLSERHPCTDWSLRQESSQSAAVCGFVF